MFGSILQFFFFAANVYYILEFKNKRRKFLSISYFTVVYCCFSVYYKSYRFLW